MLVLSRREGERVVLPDLGVEIIVQRVRGKSVSVGIEAPLDVHILRGELASSPPRERRSRPRESAGVGFSSWAKDPQGASK